MKTIESRHNPLFKRALKIVTDRKSNPDLFIVEGQKLITEAIQSGALPETYFRTCATNTCLAQLDEITIEIPPSLFKELSTTVSPPDGICIFRYSQQHDLNNILKNGKLVVIIDRLQDPGNLGTIFRTSEALGANAVIILQGTCSHLNNKVTRAAMGSSFRIPIFPGIDFTNLSKSLGKFQFTNICTDMSGSCIFDFDFPEKCALILGQEGQGISAEIKKDCAIRLAIPMQGQVESLNVATSAAICLYEWAKQQSKQ